MNIGIIVGEVSGDKLAANLFKNIFLKNKKNKYFGIVGPELKKLGCNEIFSINDLSIFGLIEPIFKIRTLIKIKKKILNNFINKIDIFIGIDFPGFNLNIENCLKNNGIFIIHIVSPSIWAWRKHRIRHIKKSVNLMMVLFPFEIKFYKKEKIPVKYIGHPLTELINIKFNEKKIKLNLNVDLNNVIISILPGSRDNEIKYHIPLYNKIIRKYDYTKNITFLIPVSNIKQYIFIKNTYFNNNFKNKINIIFNNFYNCLRISNIIITVSGTASLESALHKKLTIVVYKMNNLIFYILKKFVNIKYISLPNIISMQYVLPEYIQNNCNLKNIYNEISKKNNYILMIKKFYIIEKLNQSLKNKARLTLTTVINKFIL